MTPAQPLRLWFLAAPAIMIGVLTLGTLGIAGQHSAAVSRSFGSSQTSISYGYSAPSYGGYVAPYIPYFGSSSYAPSTSNLPPYWWSGPYASSDPSGPGTNPNSGYAWETVSVLLLETTPAKARVTLDGVFVGTNDTLGPFQLPVGEHTLRVDAPGFEPSVTVLHVEKPVLQQLEVRLSEIAHGNKPGPKS